MNMTYDTVYKIVGMEDSSQKPIFFESGLTFFTMKEPARIEDGKCQLNPVRDKLIVTLTGRVLSPGGYSVVLTHSEASKSRTITGSVNSEGNVECSHSVDTNEADSLVFERRTRSHQLIAMDHPFMSLLVSLSKSLVLQK
ncbi:hypothetical protein BLNAU_20198 [Blattamonas nauphoetae]|uniref:Uncharacterized protein n=1 Tax=Blattamonas nauphoetae TaxID=2049346 RepID=A0ABQ9WZC2_9EUKA|nr:hypothetical protein BLNAU_20198 [Blattamonas nauphoetae]